MRVPKWIVWAAFLAVGAVGGWATAQRSNAQQRAAQPQQQGAAQPGSEESARAGSSPETGLSPVGPDQASHPLTPDEKGGMEESGPYEVVADHFKPNFPDGWTWGPVRSLVEEQGKVYVAQGALLPALKKVGTLFALDASPPYSNRTGLPIRDATGSNPNGLQQFAYMVFDENGNRVAVWDHLGRGSHKMQINPWDPEKHIWLVAGTKLRKVARDTGKVVQEMGPATPDPNAYIGGRGSTWEDIAFMPNGDIWALEHSRVVKFSKDGKQLMVFGKEGRAPGELYRSHAIAIDGRERIYIGERTRIQVFDQNGKTLDIWPNIRVGSGEIVLDKNDVLWVADAEIHRIAGYNLNGKLLYHWGVAGSDPGRLYGVSNIDVDDQGNLYIAEHYGGRAQKFRPKKSANPRHLIGQLVQ